MQNASKPFGEKDIGLLSGRFEQARVRLTFIYVAILAVMLFSSSGSIYSAFSHLLQRRFAKFSIGPVPVRVVQENALSPRAQDVLIDLKTSLLFVNGILLVVAGGCSYWLAGLTLKPIQAAYERQKRFLSDASHELRTPLAILRTDLENESAATRDTQTQKRTASHLEEVARMSKLVHDLLTLSRLDEEEEKTSERRIPVSLAENIRASVERLKSTAEKHGVEIRIDESLPEDIRIDGDTELLVSALTNVLKNAIAYSERGGEVRIALETVGSLANIRITDNGIGIPAKDLERIFDRFYRADGSRSRQTGGSGLGLAIVRSIIERFGGSASIASEEGRGTTVTLTLPRSRSS